MDSRNRMSLHPFNLRILAEDLVRVRRPDDRERYSASQRQARIDPNPHQIDAVIFALRRLREGGCILADEVGLGKTIEAGLVIAQSRAEGARRILLIVPKSLIGQWQNELLNLFDIQASEDQTNFRKATPLPAGRNRLRQHCKRLPRTRFLSRSCEACRQSATRRTPIGAQRRRHEAASSNPRRIASTKPETKWRGCTRS